MNADQQMAVQHSKDNRAESLFTTAVKAITAVLESGDVSMGVGAHSDLRIARDRCEESMARIVRRWD